MKIAICDDERRIVDEIKGYLSDKGELYTYVDADILLCQSDEILFDIVFLDIELGNANGIEVARELRKRHPELLLIFMTGHHQYVYEVFEVQPIGFLRKPFQKDEVEKVFEHAAKRCDSTSYWEINVGHGMKRVELKKIFYIESDLRKVRVITTEGEVAFYGKMDQVEEKLKRLSNNFWRISQSVIINSTYVREINSETAKIDGYDGLLNISRSYREAVQEKLFELYKK